MRAFLLLALAFASATSAEQEREDSGGALRAADVRITLRPARATIVAAYRIERSGAALSFDAIRIPGQVIAIDETAGAGLSPEPARFAGLYRLVAPAGGPGAAEFRIRYSVEGDIARLPIFVPNARTVQGGGAIRLTLLGAAEAGGTGGAFPRFRRGPDGARVATPSNLPGLILLPAPGPSVGAAAEWAVVLILIGASAYWAARTARSRRRRYRRRAE